MYLTDKIVFIDSNFSGFKVSIQIIFCVHVRYIRILFFAKLRKKKYVDTETNTEREVLKKEMDGIYIITWNTKYASQFSYYASPIQQTPPPPLLLQLPSS